MAGQSKVPRGLVGTLIEVLLDTEAKSATKYLSDRLVVRAVRKTYKAHGKQIDHRDRATTIVFTIGPPNYLERRFIKDCKKAGERFPVRKIQFKYPPKKRVKVKTRKKAKKR